MYLPRFEHTIPSFSSRRIIHYITFDWCLYLRDGVYHGGRIISVYIFGMVEKKKYLRCDILEFFRNTFSGSLHIIMYATGTSRYKYIKKKLQYCFYMVISVWHLFKNRCIKKLHLLKIYFDKYISQIFLNHS